MKNTLSALDTYMNKVFKALMVILPSITLSAGSTITVVWLLGYYQEISFLTIVLFDFSTIAYLTIGILFSINSTDENGLLKPKVFFWGKAFLCLVEFTQWNFIAFMVPSREYWSYAVFFVLLSIFFIDNKLTLIIIGIIGTSTILNWIFKPDELLPVKDENYLPNIVLRIVLLSLSFFFIWLITYVLETRLVTGLETLAGVDTLTRLPNRRTLNIDFDDAIKSNRSFVAAMLDIDDFKIVNDTYGHDCGDQILKNVSSVLSYISHDNGVAYRYGGEEFLILFYLDVEESKTLAEKVRKSIENMSTRYGKFEISVTVTIGLKEYAKGESLESLITGADKNMYFGKTHGKNQIVA